MKQWTIKVFVNENGVSDFLKWRSKLPVNARAKLDQILTKMEAIRDWTQTSYFTPLSNYEGIGEIKFYIGKKQYRPLGCYGPNDREFTMLIGAEEKGGAFKPVTAPDTAAKRRKLVKSDGERYTDEY